MEHEWYHLLWEDDSVFLYDKEGTEAYRLENKLKGGVRHIKKKYDLCCYPIVRRGTDEELSSLIDFIAQSRAKAYWCMHECSDYKGYLENQKEYEKFKEALIVNIKIMRVSGA